MIIEKLKELEKKSLERKIPIIGSEKGEWLVSIIKEHKPQKILELGSANGYSGIILASQGAKLTTIELSPKSAQEAKENFNQFNTNAKIIIGDAVQEIKKINESFDLIFIDFALTKYIDVLEDCLRLLKQDGILIADNINLEVQRKTTIKHCKDFKNAILNHSKLKTKIIEIKDGLSFSKKIE